MRVLVYVSSMVFARKGKSDKIGGIIHLAGYHTTVGKPTVFGFYKNGGYPVAFGRNIATGAVNRNDGRIGRVPINIFIGRIGRRNGGNKLFTGPQVQAQGMFVKGNAGNGLCKGALKVQPEKSCYKGCIK